MRTHGAPHRWQLWPRFEAHLFAPDGADSDRFGISVAMEGDTALVGVYQAGLNKGSVYVFVRSGTTWTLQAQLFASDARSGDNFGFSVALSGGTALVGAHFDDLAGGTIGDAGSAYVFVRSDTTGPSRPTSSPPTRRAPTPSASRWR